MKSMTGFGKSSYTSDQFDIELQIRSVNNRFLDLKLYFPNELTYVDLQIRKIIQSKISRGTVEVRINYKDKRIPHAEVDYNKLDMYYKLGSDIAKHLKQEYKPDINELLQKNDLILLENNSLDNTEFTEKLLMITEETLNKHQEMALDEGKSMRVFFLESVGKMLKAIDEVEEYFQEHKSEIHDKLKSRVLELLNDHLTEENEKRILLETAIYVDKSDINEEITRLRNHIHKLKDTIEKADISPIGKTMNFILQEMHREANTLGSKFSTTNSFDNVLIIKEEVDKCKEMVLNVE